MLRAQENQSTETHPIRDTICHKLPFVLAQRSLDAPIMKEVPHACSTNWGRVCVSQQQSTRRDAQGLSPASPPLSVKCVAPCSAKFWTGRTFKGTGSPQQRTSSVLRLRQDKRKVICENTHQEKNGIWSLDKELPQGAQVCPSEVSAQEINTFYFFPFFC